MRAEPLFQDYQEVRIDNGNKPGRATGSNPVLAVRPSPPRVGILAYGSLLTWPGSELHRLINERIDRAASRRSGAPALAPVEASGCRVEGSVLLLRIEVDLDHAHHLLYRREINKAGTELTYDSNEPPSPDRVCIERLRDVEGCDHAYEKEILRQTANDDPGRGALGGPFEPNYLSNSRYLAPAPVL